MQEELKTRKKILKVTTDLFSQLPYNKVTIRKIAQNSNVSPSLVLYYFVSKEDLYCQIFEEFLLSLEGKLTQLKSKVEVCLVDVVNCYIELWRYNKSLLILMHRELLSIGESKVKQRLEFRFVQKHSELLKTTLLNLGLCKLAYQEYYCTLVMSLSIHPFIQGHSQPSSIGYDIDILKDVYHHALGC